MQTAAPLKAACVLEDTHVICLVPGLGSQSLDTPLPMALEHLAHFVGADVD